MPALSTPDNPTGLKRNAGRLGLLFSNLGGMIGSGWLFGALNAAKMAGPAAIFAWLAGACAAALLAFVYAELTTAFPRPGAIIAFPKLSHGRLAGQVMSWLAFLAYVAVPPVEATAVVTYAANLFPGLVNPGTGVLTLPGLGAALALMGMFLVVNLFAIRIVLAANTIVTALKLIVPILTIAGLLGFAFHGADFTAAGFAPYGVSGVFSAVSGAGVMFAFLGFRQSIELAGESENPARALPFAILGAVGFCAVLYVLLQIAFIGAAGPEAIANGWAALHFKGIAGPFAGLASAAGLTWLAAALYADAFISPAGTGVIYNTASGRVTFAMHAEDLLPIPLGRVTKSGVPIAALLAGFAIGLLFLLPFPSWKLLVKYLTSVGILTYGIGPVVLLTLRRALPAAAHPRPFTLPFATPIAACAFIVSNAVIFWAGADVANHLFAGLAIVFALYLIAAAIRRDLPNAADWRGAAWLFPYFAGLWALTVFAPHHAGPAATAAALIGFSLAILALAIATGLRDPAEARDSLRKARKEAALS